MKIRLFFLMLLSLSVAGLPCNRSRAAETTERRETLRLPDSEPTPRMKNWQQLKYGMFLCFGMSTYTLNEIDPGDRPSTTRCGSHQETLS